MDPWVLWLVLAVLLGVAEIATLTAAFGLLGGRRPGHLRRCAAVGLPPALQLLVFAIVCHGGPRAGPPARASGTCCAPRQERFGVDALVGRSADVVDRGDRPRRHACASAARSGPPAPTTTSLVIPAGADRARHADRRRHRPRLPPGVSRGHAEPLLIAALRPRAVRRRSPWSARCGSCRRPAPATSSGSAATTAR